MDRPDLCYCMKDADPHQFLASMREKYVEKTARLEEEQRAISSRLRQMESYVTANEESEDSYRSCVPAYASGRRSKSIPKVFTNRSETPVRDVSSSRREETTPYSTAQSTPSRSPTTNTETPVRDVATKKECTGFFQNLMENAKSILSIKCAPENRVQVDACACDLEHSQATDFSATEKTSSLICLCGTDSNTRNDFTNETTASNPTASQYNCSCQAEFTPDSNLESYNTFAEGVTQHSEHLTQSGYMTSESVCLCGMDDGYDETPTYNGILQGDYHPTGPCMCKSDFPEHNETNSNSYYKQDNTDTFPTSRSFEKTGPCMCKSNFPDQNETNYKQDTTDTFPTSRSACVSPCMCKSHFSEHNEANLDSYKHHATDTLPTSRSVDKTGPCMCKSNFPEHTETNSNSFYKQNTTDTFPTSRSVDKTGPCMCKSNFPEHTETNSNSFYKQNTTDTFPTSRSVDKTGPTNFPEHTETNSNSFYKQHTTDTFPTSGSVEKTGPCMCKANHPATNTSSSNRGNTTDTQDERTYTVEEIPTNSSGNRCNCRHCPSSLISEGMEDTYTQPSTEMIQYSEGTTSCVCTQPHCPNNQSMGTLTMQDLAVKSTNVSVTIQEGKNRGVSCCNFPTCPNNIAVSTAVSTSAPRGYQTSQTANVQLVSRAALCKLPPCPRKKDGGFGESTVQQRCCSDARCPFNRGMKLGVQNSKDNQCAFVGSPLINRTDLSFVGGTSTLPPRETGQGETPAFVITSEIASSTPAPMNTDFSACYCAPSDKETTTADSVGVPPIHFADIDTSACICQAIDKQTVTATSIGTPFVKTSDAVTACICDASDKQLQTAATATASAATAGMAAVPSVFSLDSSDILQMKTITELADKQKKIKKQVEELKEKEKKYSGAYNNFQTSINNSARCFCQMASNQNFQGDLQKLSQDLRLENSMLKGELMEMKLELKHCLEKIEGPMKQKLDYERCRCEKLQRDLQDTSRHMMTNQGNFLQEKNALQMQLCMACSNITELNQINTKLHDELNAMDCMCTKLEEDLIKQKLSEAETLKRLTARRSASASKDSQSKQREPEPFKCDSNLENIARQLSKTLKESAPCEECSKLPEELAGAARCIKELTDLVMSRKLDKRSSRCCSCQTPEQRSSGRCCTCCESVKDIGAGEPKKVKKPDKEKAKDVETLLPVPPSFVQKGPSSQLVVEEDTEKRPSAAGDQPPIVEERASPTEEALPPTQYVSAVTTLEEEKEEPRLKGATAKRGPAVSSETGAPPSEMGPIVSECGLEPCPSPCGEDGVCAISGRPCEHFLKESRSQRSGDALGDAEGDTKGKMMLAKRAILPDDAVEEAKGPSVEVMDGFLTGMIRHEYAKRGDQGVEQESVGDTQKREKSSGEVKKQSIEEVASQGITPQEMKQPSVEDRKALSQEVMPQDMKQPSVEKHESASQEVMPQEIRQPSVDHATEMSHEIMPEEMKQPSVEDRKALSQEVMPKDMKQPSVEKRESASQEVMPQEIRQPSVDHATEMSHEIMPEEMKQPSVEDRKALSQEVMPQDMKQPSVEKREPASQEMMPQEIRQPSVDHATEMSHEVMPEEMKQPSVEKRESAPQEIRQPSIDHATEMSHEIMPEEMKQPSIEDRKALSQEMKQPSVDHATEISQEAEEKPKIIEEEIDMQQPEKQPEEPASEMEPKKTWIEEKISGDFPFDASTELLVTEEPPDGLHITTTITGSGTLEVITEGPEGLIETTLTYTDSGRILVSTLMSDSKEEQETLEGELDVMRMRGTAKRGDFSLTSQKEFDEEREKMKAAQKDSMLSGASGLTGLETTSAEPSMDTNVITSYTSSKGTQEPTSGTSGITTPVSELESAGTSTLGPGPRVEGDKTPSVTFKLGESSSFKEFRPSTQAETQDKIVVAPSSEGATGDQMYMFGDEDMGVFGETLMTQSFIREEATPLFASDQEPPPSTFNSQTYLGPFIDVPTPTEPGYQLKEVSEKLNIAFDYDDDGGLPSRSEGFASVAGAYPSHDDTVLSGIEEESLTALEREMMEGEALEKASEDEERRKVEQRSAATMADKKSEISEIRQTQDCGCQSVPTVDQSCQCCECKDVGITTSGEKETFTGEMAPQEQEESDSEFVSVTEDMAEAGTTPRDSKTLGGTLDEVSTLKELPSGDATEQAGLGDDSKTGPSDTLAEITKVSEMKTQESRSGGPVNQTLSEMMKEDDFTFGDVSKESDLDVIQDQVRSIKEEEKRKSLESKERKEGVGIGLATSAHGVDQHVGPDGLMAVASRDMQTDLAKRGQQTSTGMLQGVPEPVEVQVKASSRSVSIQSDKSKTKKSDESSSSGSEDKGKKKKKKDLSPDDEDKERKKKDRSSEVPDSISKLSDIDRAPVSKSPSKTHRKKRSSKSFDIQCDCPGVCQCVVCSPEILAKRRAMLSPSIARAEAFGGGCTCPPHVRYQQVPQMAYQMQQTTSTHPVGCRCDACRCTPCAPCPTQQFSREQLLGSTTFEAGATPKKMADVLQPPGEEPPKKRPCAAGDRGKKRHPPNCECVDCLCFPTIRELAETVEFPVVFDEKQVYSVHEVKCDCSDAQAARKLVAERKSKIPVPVGSQGPSKIKTEEGRSANNQASELCDCDDPCKCQVCYFNSPPPGYPAVGASGASSRAAAASQQGGPSQAAASQQGGPSQAAASQQGGPPQAAASQQGGPSQAAASQQGGPSQQGVRSASAIAPRKEASKIASQHAPQASCADVVRTCSETPKKAASKIASQHGGGQQQPMASASRQGNQQSSNELPKKELSKTSPDIYQTPPCDCEPACDCVECSDTSVDPGEKKRMKLDVGRAMDCCCQGNCTCVTCPMEALLLRQRAIPEEEPKQVRIEEHDEECDCDVCACPNASALEGRTDQVKTAESQSKLGRWLKTKVNGEDSKPAEEQLKQAESQIKQAESRLRPAVSEHGDECDCDVCACPNADALRKVVSQVPSKAGGGEQPEAAGEEACDCDVCTCPNAEALTKTVSGVASKVLGGEEQKIVSGVPSKVAGGEEHGEECDCPTCACPSRGDLKPAMPRGGVQVSVTEARDRGECDCTPTCTCCQCSKSAKETKSREKEPSSGAAEREQPGTGGRQQPGAGEQEFGVTPCDCTECQCDPCADPNIPKRATTGPLMPCDCGECTCDPCMDPNMKRGEGHAEHPADCDCPLCACEKEIDVIDGKMSKTTSFARKTPAPHPENCDCPECTCMEEIMRTEGVASAEKTITTRVASVEKTIKTHEISTHSQICTCAECKCSDKDVSVPPIAGGTSTHSQRPAKESDKETHSPDCICDECFCPDAPKIEAADSATCQCADCKNRPEPAVACTCSDCGADTAGHPPGCQCKQCLCKECIHGLPPQPTCWDTCACADCLCAECCKPKIDRRRLQTESSQTTPKTTEDKTEDKKVSGDCRCIDCSCDVCTDPTKAGELQGAPPAGDVCRCDDCQCDVCVEEGKGGKKKKVCPKRGDDPTKCGCLSCVCEVCSDTTMKVTTTTVCNKDASGACACAECRCDGCKNIAGGVTTTTVCVKDASGACACVECRCDGCKNIKGGMTGMTMCKGADGACACAECRCDGCQNIRGGMTGMTRMTGMTMCKGADGACACAECRCDGCQNIGGGIEGKPSPLRGKMSMHAYSTGDTSKCKCIFCLCDACSEDAIHVEGQAEAKAGEGALLSAVQSRAGQPAQPGRAMGDKGETSRCKCMFCMCDVCGEDAFIATSQSQAGRTLQPTASSGGAVADKQKKGDASQCKCIFCLCDACLEDAFLSAVQSQAGQPLQQIQPSSGAIGVIQSVHVATAKRDEIIDMAMAVEVTEGETSAEQTVEMMTSSGSKIEAVQSVQITKSQPAIAAQMAPCTCCLCNLGAPLVPDRSVIGSPGPMAASGQAVPNEGIDAIQIVQATTEGGPQVEVLQSLQVATSSSQPAVAASGQVQGGAQMGSQPAMVPQKSGEQVGHCTCCTCLAKMGGQNPALVKRGLDSGAASGQMQPRTLGGSQLGVAASGQQVMPQGSMRVGSQPLGDTTIAQNGPGMYVTPSGQVVPQGSMRVGSQPGVAPVGSMQQQEVPTTEITAGQSVQIMTTELGSNVEAVQSVQIVAQMSAPLGSQPAVAASGQMVPQGSMRVGSQPGVAASGQVVPQGSMRVGSQPGGQVAPRIPGCTCVQCPLTMGVGQEPGSQPAIAAEQSVHIVASEQGSKVKSVQSVQISQPGSKPTAAASGQAVPAPSAQLGPEQGVQLSQPQVPQGSMHGGSQPAVAASGQVVPQGSMHGGSQPAVAASGQVVPQGSMHGGSQPAVAASGQVVPQGSMHGGSQPAVAASGQVVPQGSMHGGSQPAVAASGQVVPQGSMHGGSQPAVAASGQVVPQGSMHGGSQPAVAASGQMVPQGSMHGGSKPGVAASGQLEPEKSVQFSKPEVVGSGQIAIQGSMHGGSQPAVAPSGQMVPQGSMHGGSKPAVAASGQVVPQGSKQIGSADGQKIPTVALAGSGDRPTGVLGGKMPPGGGFMPSESKIVHSPPKGGIIQGATVPPTFDNLPPGFAGKPPKAKKPPGGWQRPPQGTGRPDDDAFSSSSDSSNSLVLYPYYRTDQGQTGGDNVGLVKRDQFDELGPCPCGQCPSVLVPASQSAGQMVPQGSMAPGSQPGVAASGQVIPQGSTQVGADTGDEQAVQAEQSVHVVTGSGTKIDAVQSVHIVTSGHVVPQGSMGVGSQAGGQICPCGQCPLGLVPPCQSAGQIVPQGSMGVGSQPGVAASGQVIPQGSTQVGADTGDEQTVQAEQSVHVVTDSGTKVDAVQSVHIVTKEKSSQFGSKPTIAASGQVVPQGSTTVGSQSGVVAGGQEVGTLQPCNCCKCPPMVQMATGGPNAATAKRIEFTTDIQMEHILNLAGVAATGGLPALAVEAAVDLAAKAACVLNPIEMDRDNFDFEPLIQAAREIEPILMDQPLRDLTVGQKAEIADKALTAMAHVAEDDPNLGRYGPAIQAGREIVPTIINKPLRELTDEDKVHIGGTAINAAAQTAQKFLEKAYAKRGDFGSQTAAGASGQMVPQGSMRVGSQPGVVASRQVVPQGQQDGGMFATQSVHRGADGTMEVIAEKSENMNATQSVVTYDQGQQVVVPSIQQGSRTATGAASRQMVPQGSMRVGSQPGVAASGQVVPQGSMRVGSQPGVAASRQVMPQGSMKVGSQPFGETTIAQNGPGMYVTRSGQQVVAQGVGSQPFGDTAYVGSTGQIGERQQSGGVTATQSVHFGPDRTIEVIAEESENLDAAQSVMMYDQGRQVMTEPRTPASSRQVVPTVSSAHQQGVDRCACCTCAPPAGGQLGSRTAAAAGGQVAQGQPFSGATGEVAVGQSVTTIETEIGAKIEAVQSVQLGSQPAAGASRQTVPEGSVKLGAQAKRGQEDGISPDYLGVTAIADMMGGLKKDEGLIRPAIRNMVPNPITMVMENPVTQFALSMIPGVQVKGDQFDANARAGLTSEWTPGLEVEMNQFSFNPQAGLTREWTTGLGTKTQFSFSPRGGLTLAMPKRGELGSQTAAGASSRQMVPQGSMRVGSQPGVAASGQVMPQGSANVVAQPLDATQSVMMYDQGQQVMAEPNAPAASRQVVPTISAAHQPGGDPCACCSCTPPAGGQLGSRTAAGAQMKRGPFDFSPLAGATDGGTPGLQVGLLDIPCPVGMGIRGFNPVQMDRQHYDIDPIITAAGEIEPILMDQPLRDLTLEQGAQIVNKAITAIAHVAEDDPNLGRYGPAIQAGLEIVPTIINKPLREFTEEDKVHIAGTGLNAAVQTAQKVMVRMVNKKRPEPGSQPPASESRQMVPEGSMRVGSQPGVAASEQQVTPQGSRNTGAQMKRGPFDFSPLAGATDGGTPGLQVGLLDIPCPVGMGIRGFNPVQMDRQHYDIDPIITAAGEIEPILMDQPLRDLTLEQGAQIVNKAITAIAHVAEDDPNLGRYGPAIQAGLEIVPTIINKPLREFTEEDKVHIAGTGLNAAVQTAQKVMVRMVNKKRPEPGSQPPASESRQMVPQGSMRVGSQPFGDPNLGRYGPAIPAGREIVPSVINKPLRELTEGQRMAKPKRAELGSQIAASESRQMVPEGSMRVGSQPLDATQSVMMYDQGQQVMAEPSAPAASRQVVPTISAAHQPGGDPCACCSCTPPAGGQLGSQTAASESRQMVPQGSMRVGSQPGVAASGQMVPQGSMRVGSQPGVAASGQQVMPQGSMRVGSQPFGDTTIAQNGPGMYVTQSGQMVPQGSMRVGSQPGVAASGQMVPQGSMRVGSQPGVAASGQQVMPQGSMRVGSQAFGDTTIAQNGPGMYVTQSGQVVPQGSMRVGSQPGVAASGQVVPQGSMRVGSQPGVAASRQVMPQGSMKVGSQVFSDTTITQHGTGIHVAQSVHFVDDGTAEMTTEQIENADAAQMVVMYDQSEQGLVPSIQQGSMTAAGAPSGQMVPQRSTQLGSRTAAAASGQVVPQGSMRIGSQPGVAASGQVVDQGSMRVGSQPGVAASGQVVPQGSMRIGSQPGVPVSGQVAPQAPGEQVVAEQSVQMITTELGSKVSAVQSVQMAKEESVPAIDASGLPTETGGAEVGEVTVTQSVALVPDATTETVDVDVTQTIEVVTAPDQAVAGEAVGHVSPKKEITAADAQGSQQAPQEMTPQFSAPRHPTECTCADCICSDCSGKKAQVTPKRDEISSSKTDAKAAKSSSKADTPAAKSPPKAETKPVKSSSKAGMEIPPPFEAPAAGPCDCRQCSCEVCSTKGQGRPGSARVTPKRAKNVGRDVARPTSPVHCDCPTCTCPEDLMGNVMLSGQAVGEPSSASPKPSRREGSKMKTSDACTCERKMTSRSRPTAPKSRDQKQDVEPADLKGIDSATLQMKIQAGRKENCECKEQIKEIKNALAKIKCACDQAEQRSMNNKAFVKKASEFGQTMSGLKMALTNLQDKCKAKDRMIDAMAGELKLRTSEKTMDQVFNNVQKHGTVPDYDKGDDVRGKGVGNQPSTKILYPVEEERREGDSRQRKRRTKRDCKCGKHHVTQKEEKDCQKIDLGNFEVTDIRRITDDSIIVKWTASSDEDICGYDIFVNGVMSSKVMSGARTSAMVYSLDLSRTIQITIYAVTKCGRCEPPAIAIYEIDSK